MKKTPASTSLDSEVYDRLATLAQSDGRSVANVMELCIQAGLPVVEAQLAPRKTVETFLGRCKYDSRVKIRRRPSRCQ